MDANKINKILFQIRNWAGYLLVFLMALFFISGYGMTKGIIDPILAKYLHENLLPIPTSFFLIVHVLINFKFILKRWGIKDEFWTNVYLTLLGLIIFIIFLYFHFL